MIHELIVRKNTSYKKPTATKKTFKKLRTSNRVRSVHWKRELRMYVRARTDIKTLAVGRRMLALDQYTLRSFRN